MELDLNKFRTLIPISALYEHNLMQLARQAKLEHYSKGDKVFSQDKYKEHSAFLMTGSVQLLLNGTDPTEVSAGSSAANYALPQDYEATITSDKAKVVWVNRLLLERLLAWGEGSEPIPEDDNQQGPSALDSEWMMAMLQTQAFLKLPAQNIQELFSRMQELKVNKGDVIVKFGEIGNYYYMVKNGRCQIVRPTADGEEILAEIGRGSSFGEESLIGGSPRNATIVMQTQGTLMRLFKQDFLELINEPVLNWVDILELEQMVDDGASLVDVRLEAEFNNSKLNNAINIPLGKIRQQGKELDKNTSYILYCDTGQRSSTAAFLLSELGLDVYVLRNGLSGN